MMASAKLLSFALLVLTTVAMIGVPSADTSSVPYGPDVILPCRGNYICFIHTDGRQYGCPQGGKCIPNGNYDQHGYAQGKCFCAHG
uniref:Putative secreted protein n=1 Tax=Amblyomma americanum TaxID=6943 RepID=A0A0C9SEJ8_AMBAM